MQRIVRADEFMRVHACMTCSGLVAMDPSSSPDESNQLPEETEPPADDSPGMPSLPTGPPTPNPDTKGGAPRHPKTTLRELHRTRTLRVQAVLQELRARVT